MLNSSSAKDASNSRAVAGAMQALQVKIAKLAHVNGELKEL